MCLAAKFRLEKGQPGGNLRYRSCSISPCVSRPSSGWRNASQGGTSGIDPAAFHHVSCGQVQAGETPAGGEPQVKILQHFTTCLAAKFRLEKRQPGGNLRYRSCSISPCVSRPSSGWRKASRGGISGIDPAAFHHVSRGQLQAGETPARGEPQV
jgi:hypothetical protein